MINNYIADRSYAIVSGFLGETVASEMGVTSRIDDIIVINFPKGNLFGQGQNVSVYLDNRTGVEQVDANLNVYRVAVKGYVESATAGIMVVKPEFYELFYGNSIIERFSIPGYEHSLDRREILAIPESPLLESDFSGDFVIDNNKVGVFITKASERPHSTVMAYLSNQRDDIFLISHRGSFKSENILRDRECAFAIDHRAEITFERAVFWNYTIIRGLIYRISENNSLFPVIQAAFVEKNPWEQVFFTHENIEMFHIQPQEIICPEKYFHFIQSEAQKALQV